MFKAFIFLHSRQICSEIKKLAALKRMLPCLTTSAMNLRFRLAAFAIVVNRIVDLRARNAWGDVFLCFVLGVHDTIKNVQPNSFDWHEGSIEITISLWLQDWYLH